MSWQQVFYELSELISRTWRLCNRATARQGRRIGEHDRAAPFRSHVNDQVSRISVRIPIAEFVW